MHVSFKYNTCERQHITFNIHLNLNISKNIYLCTSFTSHFPLDTISKTSFVLTVQKYHFSKKK